MEQTPDVCIIDYGLGNVASVQNALRLLRCNSVISGEAQTIAEASHLILPGVGSFGDGMRNLRQRGLVDLLREEVLHKKKKILGICLGMQLFASRGFEYGEFEGLNYIKGKVVKIDTSQSKLRLPHIGWNDTKFTGQHKITRGVEDRSSFYFVHSFHFVPEDGKVIAGLVDYGLDLAAIVESENIFGTQFHPEKSHTSGLRIIKNFLAA